MMKKARPYPPLIPSIDQWPIYKLSQDRKRFIQEINAFTLERLLKQFPKTHDLIATTVYQERLRLKETPWKVDPPNEGNFWSRIRRQLVKSEQENAAKKRERYKFVLERIIHRYSEEIVGNFSIRTFKFARRFLTFFFRRLLNAAVEKWWRILGSRYQLHERIRVYGATDTVRSLMDKGIVVAVPTHFSNIDSILVGFALDHVVGLPSFAYGAGLNLYNSGLPAFFMNRLGAYRVDRRKKNAIYLETLKSMSMLAIKRGTNMLFFPGGTRSRDGKLEHKLKLGLLGTTVEAQRALCQEGRPQKIFIVPIVMSYHFVLEAPFLIHQHLQITGKEKYLKGRSEGNSLREWFKFVWQFFAKKSDITLSIGAPLDVLGNFVDADGNSYDSRQQPIQIADYFRTEGGVTEDLQREAEYTKILAEKIVDRYQKENIVLSSHVVAFTAFQILKANNDGLDLYALLRQMPDDFIFPRAIFIKAIADIQKALFQLAEKGRLQLSTQIQLDPEALMLDGISNLGVYHIRKPLLMNKIGDIESDDFNVLYYYNNRLENFGLDKALRWDKYKMIVKMDLDDTDTTS